MTCLKNICIALSKSPFGINLQLKEYENSYIFNYQHIKYTCRYSFSKSQTMKKLAELLIFLP